MNNLVNIKSFLKFLQKNKAYTAIDVFGLSVSLMFVILIGVYTYQELSVDRFQEHADEVYLLGCESRYELAYPLSYRVQERYPEVEAVCPMVASNFDGLGIHVGDRKYNVNLLFADTTFFSFFSFPLVSGNREQALEARNNAVVSESFARKAFPGEDPIGKVIQVNDSLKVTVSAVMKDIRHSMIPYCDLLIAIDNVHYLNGSLTRDGLGNAGSALNFLKTRQGRALQAKSDEMAAWFKEFFWVYRRGMAEKVLITPMREVYFGEVEAWSLNQGDWKFVMILMSVGILILLFAVINYVNLTVAQTGFRAKEMATRRLLGSTRGELFVRLIFESTLLCLLSFVIGLVLAFAVVPFANDLLQTKIDLAGAVTPLSVVVSLLLVVVIGGIAGLLPAIVISNAKPIEVVRGSFRTKSKMVFSKFFITFQNVITIALVACSLTMILQINHMLHAPLGYNTHNIIDIEAWNIGSNERAQAFANELRRQSCVTNVGLSMGSPMGGQNNNTVVYEGRNISFQQLIGDQACFDILGIEILRDNQLADPGKGYFFNEEGMRQMGLADDAPSVTFEGWGESCPVLGIVKDFHLGNITEEKKPMMLRLRKSNEITPWNILVEVNGDPYEAMKTVSRIWEELTQVDFVGEYIDQQIQNSFASQKRTAKIISLFASIAVLISLLGLLAMSTYFIQQRKTEVSVRKVFGSTNREILVKLVSTFLSYVGVAFVVAVPFIWYVMKRWLSDYSYRIDLSPLIFAAAGLFCLLISFLTVFAQSWRAANANPVDSFRNRL